MKTILVALDGSDRAPAVLEQAVTLARYMGARLVLYRAVGVPAELPLVALSKAPDDVANLLVGIARDAVETLARKQAPELAYRVVVALAIPWQGVCEAARGEGADLVVIGSHGYGGLDRILGTTAARIVNHCDVSVLVVKSR